MASVSSSRIVALLGMWLAFCAPRLRADSTPLLNLSSASAAVVDKVAVPTGSEKPSESRPLPDVTSDMKSELEALRKRIDELEQAQGNSSPPNADTSSDGTSDKKKEDSKPKNEKDSSDGPKAKEVEPKDDLQKSLDAWQDMSTDKWTVKLGGHVQLDYINWLTASDSITGDQDYFEFRRLRLVADGTGYGVFDFRLQMTLEPETVGESPAGTVISPDVKDAYLSMNEIPYLGRMRIGNFFVPFSLEQVTNDTNNIFVERSIPTQGVFAADREVGIAFYNCTDDLNLTWSHGIFFDSISEGLKERIDDNQGYRVSGRVTWLPYYDEPSNGRYLLHTGLGILHTDDQDNRVRFRARPQVREGPRLIDSGAIAADSFTTANFELASVFGPMTLQGEGFISTIRQDNGETPTVDGAYIHASYFLTGENRIFDRFGQHGAQFSRNVPYSNFFLVPGGVGTGAWEAKARYSLLDLHKLERGRYQDLTLGLNWYWSDRTRVMMDWIHPFTTQDTPFGSAQADLLALRFDFNW
jgi:phosphate-selective porin OprO and OprP